MSSSPQSSQEFPSLTADSPRVQRPGICQQLWHHASTTAAVSFSDPPPPTPRASRPRAQTDTTPGPSAASFTERRRITQQAPPRIELPPLSAEESDSSHPSETFSQSSSQYLSTTATEAISIPVRQRSPSRPTTPLTGRNPSGHLFPYSSDSSEPDQSFLRPVKQKKAKRVVKANRALHSRQPSDTYRPTSPLSCMMPSSQRSQPMAVPLHPSPDGNRHHMRQAPQPMDLSNLPRFHPAKYESAESNPTVRSRHLSRPGSAGRTFSPNQHKVNQYARDVASK